MRWFASRIASTIPVVLIVSLLTFSLIQLLPGDPAVVLAGQEASEETIDRIRQDLGLDRPLVVQYGTWLADVATGDLGTSLQDGRPVTTHIAERLPATIQLAVMSLLAAILVAIPMGIVAARGSGRVSGALTSLVTFSGISVPSFWFGIMLIYVFSVKLGWFSAGGYVPLWQDWSQNLMLMVLPVAATGFRRSATIARFVRSSVLDVQGQDYVRVAEAKGLRDRIVMRRYVLANAMIPVITVSGLQLAEMVGGLVLTETVFSIPGLARLIVEGIFARDFVLVQGALLVVALMVVAINLVVDFLYTLADPRISLRPEVA